MTSIYNNDLSAFAKYQETWINALHPHHLWLHPHRGIIIYIYTWIYMDIYTYIYMEHNSPACTQSINQLHHWENYISISFLFEWDLIAVTVFITFLNQIEFHLVQNRKENSRYDYIPFILKGNQNIVFSLQFLHELSCCLKKNWTEHHPHTS